MPTSYYLSRQTSLFLFSLSSCPPNVPTSYLTNVPTSYLSFSHLTFAPLPIFISSISSFSFPPVMPTSYNLSASLPSFPPPSPYLMPTHHLHPHQLPPFYPPLPHPPPTHPPPTVHPDTPVLARPANRAHPNWPQDPGAWGGQEKKAGNIIAKCLNIMQIPVAFSVIWLYSAYFRGFWILSSTLYTPAAKYKLQKLLEQFSRAV